MEFVSCKRAPASSFAHRELKLWVESGPNLWLVERLDRLRFIISYSLKLRLASSLDSSLARIPFHLIPLEDEMRHRTSGCRLWWAAHWNFQWGVSLARSRNQSVWLSLLSPDLNSDHLFSLVHLSGIVSVWFSLLVCHWASLSLGLRFATLWVVMLVGSTNSAL